MEIIVAILGFVQLIVLFKFFEMSRDIWKIRNRVGSEDPKFWLNEYNKSMYLGRSSQALFALQEFIWYSIQKNKDKRSYEELKGKYQDELNKLGGEFPIYPF